MKDLVKAFQLQHRWTLTFAKVQTIQQQQRDHSSGLFEWRDGEEMASRYYTRRRSSRLAEMANRRDVYYNGDSGGDDSEVGEVDADALFNALLPDDDEEGNEEREATSRMASGE